MGRKKIEIRPLTDERNRNVTFLKRKAGLMKKAWELSVLCGADVSILIFSSQGKAYEFSSKDLDGEIDKYLDYEGLIERRRAEEFAAMALAGEDDDDDEDDTGRRGSTSKVGAMGQPTKSLKGKESFKARQPSRHEIERVLSKAKDKDMRRRSHKRRTRRVREDGRGRTFVDDLVSDEDSSDSESDRDRDDGRRKRRRDDGPDDSQPGLAGLQYALSMHQAPALPQSEEQLPNFFAHSQNSLPRPSAAYRSLPGSVGGYEAWQSGGLGPEAQYGYIPQHPGHPIPGPHGGPGNMQWNQELLTRYAEFQLQQNHQKQQRALLERQRAQMADLGIPIDDRGLLDQIFGGPSASMVSPVQDVGSTQSSGNMSASEPFEWPHVSSARSREEASKESMYAYANQDEQRYTDDGIPWGVGSGERVALPTPPSPGMKRRDEGYPAGMDERRRAGVTL